MGLQRIFIRVLKVIPILLSIMYTLDVILNYFEIEADFLVYTGFISITPMLFLILASFALKFCIWHRLPLYHIVLSNILSYVFWLIGFTPGWIVGVILILFGSFTILGAYLKNKYNEQRLVN